VTNLSDAFLQLFVADAQKTETSIIFVNDCVG